MRQFLEEPFALILLVIGSFLLGLRVSIIYIHYKYNISKKPVCTCGPSSDNGCMICCLRSESGMVKLSKDEIRVMRRGRVSWGSK